MIAKAFCKDVKTPFTILTSLNHAINSVANCRFAESPLLAEKPLDKLKIVNHRKSQTANSLNLAPIQNHLA
jgi:hypothetical protein